MEFKTAFSCGDQGWVFNGSRVVALTIGLIRPCMIDSRSAKTSYTEEYMCNETGIGSGSVYTLGKTIFVTREECEAAAADQIRKNQEYADAEAARKVREAQESIEYYKRELARAERLAASRSAS
jgi:hypothetical protein